MTLILSGTDGLSDVDGTAATPAIRGTDTNTGIFFPAADTIAFSEGGVESMRIDSSGNLGIGTSSPSVKLDVNGICNFGGSSGVRAGVGTAFAIGQAELYAQGTVPLGVGTAGSTSIQFYTNSTERARIDSSGLIGVGMLPAASVRLSVASSSSFIMVGRDSTGTTDQFRIASNGNVTNTNNSYGIISDLKLKENIVDASPKLAELMRVRIVNYNLKGELGYETNKQIGVIAQEVEQVFPGLIDELSDFDAEGNELGTTTKSVKMSVFVPMLIKAIQEQQAIIQSLTARIEALEGK